MPWEPGRAVRLRPVSLGGRQRTAEAHTGLRKPAVPPRGRQGAAACRSGPGHRYSSPVTNSHVGRWLRSPTPSCGWHCRPGWGRDTPRPLHPPPPPELASYRRVSSAPPRPPAHRRVLRPGCPRPSPRCPLRFGAASRRGFPHLASPRGRPRASRCCLCRNVTSALCLQAETGGSPRQTRRAGRGWHAAGGGGRRGGSPASSGGSSPGPQVWSTPCP